MDLVNEFNMISSPDKKSFDDGKVLELLPSCRRNGTQLAPLKLPDNQIIMNKGTEMVRSRRPNSTEQLGKRVRYLMSILALCSNPIKNSELMEAIDYKNQKAFRDNYLMPLRQVGYIVLTNPENPTDPENKYTLTEAGKIFLGGML